MDVYVPRVWIKDNPGSLGKSDHSGSMGLALQAGYVARGNEIEAQRNKEFHCVKLFNDNFYCNKTQHVTEANC